MFRSEYEAAKLCDMGIEVSQDCILLALLLNLVVGLSLQLITLTLVVIIAEKALRAGSKSLLKGF